MKPVYQISFSGGLSSAYMTYWLIQNFSHLYDFIVTYANTGIEKEETLQFIKNCDEQLNFNTVWLEAVIHPAKRVGTTHKIVDFYTATRDPSIFEKMIEKYGIPNLVYKHCTRELKIRSMDSYIRSLGHKPTKVPTAIGIRADEAKRMAGDADKKNFVYPLVTDNPVDKLFVKDFWGSMPFNLGLSEEEGNCNMCFEKSFPKLFKQLDANPNALEFHLRMEDIHSQTNNREGHPDRVFFRQNKSALDVLAMYEEHKRVRTQ